MLQGLSAGRKRIKTFTARARLGGDTCTTSYRSALPSTYLYLITSHLPHPQTSCARSWRNMVLKVGGGWWWWGA